MLGTVRQSLSLSTSNAPMLLHTSMAQQVARRLATVCPLHSISILANRRSLSTVATSAPSTLNLPHILFVTGGPGAGKGTQCTLLTQEFGADVKGEDGNDVIPSAAVNAPSHAVRKPIKSSRPFGVVHISVGAVLRRASSPQDASSSSNETNPNSCSSLSPADRSFVTEVLSRGGILPGHLTVMLLRDEFQRCILAQRSIDPLKEVVFLVDGFPRTVDNAVEFARHCGPIESILLLECDERRMMTRLMNRGRSDDKVEIIRRRIVGFDKETMPAVKWLTEGIAPSPSSSSVSVSSGRSESLPPPSKVVHFYRLDGRPSIDTVYSTTRRTFLQWLKATTDISVAE